MIPKISIIVPVFNKTAYLRECLDSLIHQTLQEIEIICVDDCSTDDSLSLLLDYSERDSRIVVISNKKNKGVSATRNRGIREARGEFIAFVDADDYVETDFYERLYKVSDGYDCVKGEIWDYLPDTNYCKLNEVYNLNDKIKRTGNPFYFYYGFTSAIYRKSFIDQYGFHFPEGISYYEDPFFTMTLVTKLDAIKIVDNARYYYRKVPSSLSSNVDKQDIEELLQSTVGIMQYLNSCELSHENKYILVNQIITFLNGINKSESLSGDYFNQLRKEYLVAVNEPIESVKVSVIVPVYNGEKYLRRTLSCLSFQSLYEIEIICVNDCSQDNSLQILKEYQREDNRIKVIDCKTNGGESKARNIGIEAATGEYIAFMDQDDRIDLLFYEKVYAKAIETNADIAKGSAIEVDYYGGSYVVSYPVKKGPLYFAGTWWTGIFRRELIINNNIRLPEGYPLGGDLKFLFDACCVANKVEHERTVYYYHIMHPDSGDSMITPMPKLVSTLEIFDTILESIESMNSAGIETEVFEYYCCSYINHSYERISRCKELDAKLLCTDFIFRHYNACHDKERICKDLETRSTLLAYALRNNNKTFLDEIITKDVLNEIFYTHKNDNEKKAIPYTIIVPYINKGLVTKYIEDNAFIRNEEQLTCSFIDNRIENLGISTLYNRFLDNYDYSNESWLIFMHSDFEFLTYPSSILSSLDKDKIYGPVGAKSYFNKEKVGFAHKGKVYEQDCENILYENFLVNLCEQDVDTLDCMCMIIHSTLIDKHHLRFDEKLLFDLYVEDFCINSRKNNNIEIEALSFDCAHHSSYVREKYYSDRYLAQLEYLNNKYPDDIYGGTVSQIGGKRIPIMSNEEMKIFKLRYEIKTGKKL